MQKPKLSNPSPINMYLSQPISPLFHNSTSRLTLSHPMHVLRVLSLSLSLSLSLCWRPLQVNFLYLSSSLLFQITLASFQLYGLVFLSFLFFCSYLTTGHSQYVVLLLLIDFYLLVSPLFSVLLYFSCVSLLFIPCTCYWLHFLFFFFFFLFSSLLTVAFLVA
jgi:hypothetical protein